MKWKLVPVKPTFEMLNARHAIPMEESTPQGRWEAMLSAAPTPPEVEPVGKVVKIFNIDRLYDGLEAVFSDNADINDGDLLYTSPPSPADELRKAAEDVANWKDLYGTNRLFPLIENLRAALNKGKS
jgi:hypothetical protein